MFGRATIRLGIGPHSSLLFFSVYLENYKAVNIDHAERYLLSTYKSRHELGCTVRLNVCKL